MEYKYFICRRDLNYYGFKNLKDLLYWIGDKNNLYEYGHNWNDTFQHAFWAKGKLVEDLVKVEYIIFDFSWTVVSLQYIKEQFYKIDLTAYKPTWRKTKKKCFVKYRVDPVPHTGKRSCRCSRSKWHKLVKYLSSERYWKKVIRYIELPYIY